MPSFSLANFELFLAPSGQLLSFDAPPSHPNAPFALGEGPFELRLAGADVELWGRGALALAFPGAARACSEWPNRALPTFVCAMGPAGAPAWAKRVPWAA